MVEPVETTPDTINVLFVCTANICRSPFMELAARELVGPDARIVFSSAGTRGFRDHAMDATMATTLTPRSLSGDTFISRPLTADLIDEADLVLTAEAAQRTYILDDHPAAFRKIFTLGQFAESVKAADPSLGGRDLLAAVGERRSTADPALDVPDPYSRGPEAADACASTIEELLRVVVPALTGSRKITS